MYAGKLVFAQVVDHLPWHRFHRLVDQYNGNRKVQSFSCSDQYRCMAFAQLTYRSSLRDIETCLRAQASKLYHMGIRGDVARNTLSNANNVRDWRLHAAFAQHLIHVARNLHRRESHGLDLDNTVYALDSSTIDLCLSLFPRARFRKTKAAVKLHTLPDLRGNIPAFIHITEGKLHDVNILDIMAPKPGAFYVMDRAYLDFARLHRLHLNAAHFVLQAKKNTKLKRLRSRQVDRTTGIIRDQTVVPAGVTKSKDHPDKLRRIKYFDSATERTLAFLTNDFVLPPLIVADIYKSRWQVELFFKWIKQHLRISHSFAFCVVICGSEIVTGVAQIFDRHDSRVLRCHHHTMKLRPSDVLKVNAGQAVVARVKGDYIPSSPTRRNHSGFFVHLMSTVRVTNRARSSGVMPSGKTIFSSSSAFLG